MPDLRRLLRSSIKVGVAFLSTVIEKNRQSEFIEIFDYFIRLVKEYKKTQ